METKHVRASAPPSSGQCAQPPQQGRRELHVRARPHPRSDSPHGQLRKVCPQSMRAAVPTGILVAPMSGHVGRARAGCVKSQTPQKHQRELHSYTKKTREPARERLVMHCKHPIFSVTRSFGSGSQVDRPPAPASIPGETKALTGNSSPTSPGVGRTRRTSASL